MCHPEVHYGPHTWPVWGNDRLTKAALVSALLQPRTAGQLAAAGKIQLNGDSTVLDALSGVLDQFEPTFNMVTP